MQKNNLFKKTQNPEKEIELEYSSNKIKIISFFSIIGVILLLLFSMSAFVPKNWIIAGGSTSVDPIMIQLSPWYKKNYKQDFIYNSMGSAAASVGITNGYYDMGFESKKISPVPNNSTSFTIAQDYFIILFNLPEGITGSDDKNPSEVKLPENDSQHKQLGKIMEDIYAGETFASFNDDVNTIAHYYPLKISNNESGLKKISTFTRESGSGTRDYMEKNIIGGTSASTSNASVESSNGGMMNAIQSSVGSMGYLSFSYINQILKDNLSMASVDNESPYKLIGSKTPIFNEDYSLKRPFAGIVRNNSSDLKTCLEFINRILYSPQPDNSNYEINDQIKINPISEMIYNLGFEPACYNKKSYGGSSSDYNPNGEDSAIRKLMNKNDIKVESQGDPF